MKPEGLLPHLQVPANCLYPINPVHPHRPTSCRSILILSSHLRLGLQSGHSLKFPLQNLVQTLFSLIGATCSAHLILIDLFIRIMFGEEYRSLNSSVCSCLYSSLLNSPSNLIYDVIQILNIRYVHLCKGCLLENFNLPDGIFYPSSQEEPLRGPKVQITVGSFRIHLQ
jgi:hypothetical protein